MKITRFSLWCLLAVGLASLCLWAEEPVLRQGIAPQFQVGTTIDTRVWHIGIYPYNQDKAADGINQVLAKGLVPVGIEVVTGDSIQILYSRDSPNKSKKWVLELIDDTKKIEPELLSLVQKGFEPVDIAVQAEGIYVLAVESPQKIQAVRLFTTKKDMDSLNKELSSYNQQGFYPVGMSQYGANFWVLVIKSESRPYRVATIWPCLNDGDSFVKNLEAQTASGVVPYGFAIDKQMIYAIFAK